MSAERIKKAALARFANQGYDATSLAQIAGDVGIKTPSIYAHFRGKQALFRQLAEGAFADELEEARTRLERPQAVREALHGYLYDTVDRFATAPSLRFWLRAMYLPPPKMLEEIRALDRRFAAALKTVLSAALAHPLHGLQQPLLPRETLASAFIGILRGLHADLMYCSGTDSTDVLSSLWTIYERSLVEC